MLWDIGGPASRWRGGWRALSWRLLAREPPSASSLSPGLRAKFSVLWVHIWCAVSLMTIRKRGWEEKTEMTKHSLARPNQVETSKLMRPCKVDRNASFKVYSCFRHRKANQPTSHCEWLKFLREQNHSSQRACPQSLKKEPGVRNKEWVGCLSLPKRKIMGSLWIWVHKFLNPVISLSFFLSCSSGLECCLCEFWKIWVCALAQCMNLWK